MKRIFIAFSVLAATLLMYSCGNEKKATEHFVQKGYGVKEDGTSPILPYGDKEKFDTLSYILGTNIGNIIDSNLIPYLQLNYDEMYAALTQCITTDQPLKSGSTIISEENLMQIGESIFTNEFQIKIQQAAIDSTGSIELYSNGQEKELVTYFQAAALCKDIKSAAGTMPLQAYWILEGCKDQHNKSSKISNEDAEEFLRTYWTVTIPAKAKAESEQWLAEIEEMDGVKKTESGILYLVEEPGDNKIKATADTDTVKVLYTGRNRYSDVFDSNRWADMPENRKQMISTYAPEMAEKDNPVEFPLNGVIKGWTEGMKLIGKGGKIILWIPAELAYGEQGAGGDIGPNEALRFDIELIEVNGK